MLSRWTIADLENTDDLTFAMCIIDERLRKVQMGTPLEKKLRSAHSTLEELRDCCRNNANYQRGLSSAKEAVYRVVRREYLIQELSANMEDDKIAEFLAKHNLDAESVLGDPEMMDQIIERYFKYDCTTSDYWTTFETAITEGVLLTLGSRQSNESMG